MQNFEKKVFRLYSTLLRAGALSLSDKEQALLRALGVKLTFQNNKYFITDLDQHHLPYQKEHFPKNLHPFLQLEDIISSTLDIARIRPEQLIIAEAQTVGRGQYERRWYSALGRQILLTYHVEYKVRAFDAIWALWKVLEPLGIAFKWPNDLYHHSGKIAGVISFQEHLSACVSFGLNLSLQSRWPLGSLSLPPSKISREQLIISWLECFDEAKNTSQEEIISDLSRGSMINDLEEVIFNDKVFLFNGLSHDGSVKLRHKNSSKISLLVSGSLRPADPLGWFFQQNAQNSCDEQKK